MNSVIDTLNNNLSPVSISRGKYDSLLIAESQRNNLIDLIENRYDNAEGLTFEDIRLIYDLMINPSLVKCNNIEDSEMENEK